MAALAEQIIIDNLASQAQAINGIRHAYGFAQYPDALQSAMLPAMVFWASFESSSGGHRNLWRNQFDIKGVLFVAPRESRGTTLKFLENDALPFGLKVREKFQGETALQQLLGISKSISEGWLLSGKYSAEDPLLKYNGVQYIGWIFTWRFVEVN